jgi:hypothetical protein
MTEQLAGTCCQPQLGEVLRSPQVLARDGLHSSDPVDDHVASAGSQVADICIVEYSMSAGSHTRSTRNRRPRD